MLAAGVAPQLLLARRIGRLVDTHDSRRLLVAGGLVEVAATIPLIFLHSVVPIVALVAVLGAASSMTGATWSALIPRVVGEDQLAEAISTQQSLSVLALVAAPAVGGLLAGAFGTGLPVALDAATFVVVTVAAVLVRTRRVPERIPATDGSQGATERIRHHPDRPGPRSTLRRGGSRRPPGRHGRRRARLPGAGDPPRRRRLVRRGRGLLDGRHGGRGRRCGPGRDRPRTGTRHHRRNSGRLRRCGRVRRRTGGVDPRPDLDFRRDRQRLRRNLPLDLAPLPHGRQRARSHIRRGQRDPRRRPGRLAPARRRRRDRALPEGDLCRRRPARPGGSGGPRRHARLPGARAGTRVGPRRTTESVAAG